MTEENKMEYVRLGKSGLKISRDAHLMGIRQIEPGAWKKLKESERILGKAIKQFDLPRDEIVVMTKVLVAVGRGKESVASKTAKELESLRYTNQFGLSRKHIFESIKHSLERLQLDYVDVFQCHRFDYDTPIEETMEALHDVVKAGYARYIGMSSCHAWQFHKMQNYARSRGLTEFISMQNLYNPVYREEEREMIPLLKDLGVGMINWSPNAGGHLTRPFGSETERGGTDLATKRMASAPFLETVNKRVQEIANARGVSMARVVLAWNLSKDFISAPILGTSSLEKLRDSVGAIQLKLTVEEIQSIDEAYQTRAVWGIV
ncbi:hypothetical protein FS837_003402 [Tulasnella sp. UAMH 9824]|nr:hypothetical protein FS837_003402 [Tulasnella sp. UAMH 9824]